MGWSAALVAEHQDCTSSVTQLQQFGFGLRRPEALWVPSGAAPRVADLKLPEKVECGCHLVSLAEVLFLCPSMDFDSQVVDACLPIGCLDKLSGWMPYGLAI
ncbi:unnamed protein product [Prunus armeniaca]